MDIRKLEHHAQNDPDAYGYSGALCRSNPVSYTHLTPVLSRRQLDELEVLVVDHPQVKASFALQGAHLLSLSLIHI